jgi:hypothetical protein
MKIEEEKGKESKSKKTTNRDVSNFDSNGSSIEISKETPLSSTLKSFEPPNEHE